MNYEPSGLCVVAFLSIIAAMVGLSVHLLRRSRSPSGYFVASGSVHWSVNGLAFVGDYLSAASFLGVGGLIAVVGMMVFSMRWDFSPAGWSRYYSLQNHCGGWDEFTFSDAVDARFNSKAVRLTSAVSTLIVCLFYLIPQMVGAGALVTPLLGVPQYMGVLVVGVAVTIIVATAGMTSTTYVQYLKGGVLLIVAGVLVAAVLDRGFSPPSQPRTQISVLAADGRLSLDHPEFSLPEDWSTSAEFKAGFVPLVHKGLRAPWAIDHKSSTLWHLSPTQTVTQRENAETLYNGLPLEQGGLKPVGQMAVLRLSDGCDAGEAEGHRLSPLSYLRTIYRSDLYRWSQRRITDGEQRIQVFYREQVAGRNLMQSGGLFKLDQGGGVARLDFVSLMLGLICGTAALPHILIRYYTVADALAARRSTVLAIVAIGLFYLMSLFLGLGAMVGGAMNLLDSNMALPLLARSFGPSLFAVLSAVAFMAVLGTVSGLIIASSGAVAHDIMDRFMGMSMTASEKVVAGRMAAVIVGCVAIYLGIVFEGMNVSYLAGWVFAVAASANLPALVMSLFWKKTTSGGVVASIVVGLVSSLTLILLSPEMFVRYGFSPSVSPLAMNHPALLSLPLSLLTLVAVSHMSQPSSTI